MDNGADARLAGRCSGCGEHTDPLFDVSKSTTAKYLTCSAFGSCNACEEDKCYISQASNRNQTFVLACQ